MSVEQRQVIVCDGTIDGDKCDRVIQKDEAHIVVYMRAMRSDIDKPYGMEGHTAMSKAGLVKHKHFHISCQAPASLLGELVANAATVTQALLDEGD